MTGFAFYTVAKEPSVPADEWKKFPAMIFFAVSFISLLYLIYLLITNIFLG